MGQIKTIDANILIDYLLQDSIDRDLKTRIRKLLQPSNSGDITIRIFVYTLGEVFKRLLDVRDGETLDMSENSIQMNLGKLQGWVRDGYMTILRMDGLSADFFRHYNAIDGMDSIISKGDKIALAAFCADAQSKAFYSNDRNVVNSMKVTEYVRSQDPDKAILEL